MGGKDMMKQDVTGVSQVSVPESLPEVTWSHSLWLHTVIPGTLSACLIITLAELVFYPQHHHKDT